MVISAGLSWFAAQIIKVFTGMFRERRFSVLTLLFSNGGMPSSHSACVSALFTASAIEYGPASSQFAICLIMAIVVMGDAAGVRYETGKQAKIINGIVKELFSKDPEKVNTGLKELVGHTPFQVFIGALLGVMIAVACSFFML